MSRRARPLAAALAGALLVLVVVASTPAPAGAHALLTGSTPADGASVEEAPEEVLLTFNEALDPALSTVQVLASSGEPTGGSGAEPVPGQPAQLRVPLGDLAEGVYTATWRVTSPSDGHTTVGAVAFGVGVPATPVGSDGAAASVESPAPTVASVVGRWLFYAGVVLLLGAAVVGVLVVSKPTAIPRWGLAASWAAAAVGVILTTADKSASTQTGVGELLSSATGHKLAWQAAAVALLGATVAWAAKRPSRSTLLAIGIAASAAMLARALAGHANAASPRWFTVGMQWSHLVSVGAWVGGLVWLLLALRRGDPGQGPGLARRFSSVAAATLGVVALTGTVRAVDEVGAWSRLLDTDFGVTLLVKLGLFSGLVVLAARNRFRHVAAAAASRIGGLRRAVRGEVVLAAGVLGATAWLAGLAPSATVAAASRSGTSTVTVRGSDYATSVRARLEISPGSAGPNRFQLEVEDYDSGEPVPAEAVSLRFQLDDRPDVAAATLDLARDGETDWEGTGNVLSISGWWTVTALVQMPSDAVEVPMEFETRTTAPASGGSTDARPCPNGPRDPSLSVAVAPEPDPPKAEGAVLHLTVQKDGRPLTGAKVCVRVNMPDMQHRGVTALATEAIEASGGRYDARIRFSMTGGWEGSVVVTPPGEEPVSAPIKLEVK